MDLPSRHANFRGSTEEITVYVYRILVDLMSFKRNGVLRRPNKKLYVDEL